jgi:NAD(P)-dependent dehydrogenase (short-subunit alcohol dehydrogenase family)
MSDKLNNTGVLLLGGSSGIGLAAAAAAVEAGASVTIASRSQSKLDAAHAELGADDWRGWRGLIAARPAVGPRAACETLTSVCACALHRRV